MDGEAEEVSWGHQVVKWSNSNADGMQEDREKVKENKTGKDV